jgi:hypothetical protein
MGAFAMPASSVALGYGLMQRFAGLDGSFGNLESMLVVAFKDKQFHTRSMTPYDVDEDLCIHHATDCISREAETTRFHRSPGAGEDAVAF